VPRAPSHLRRPLRVPSFAPTLLPEPRTVATDSIRFPSNFFSPHPPALSPGPAHLPSVRHLSPNPPLFTPPTHPARTAAQVVSVVCTSLHEPGRRFFTVGPFPILTTCLVRLSGTPKSDPRIKRTPDSWDQHARNGRALNIWFVTPATRAAAVPLYFVLLTSSYDLLSFTRVRVLRDPVVAGIRFLYLYRRHDLRPRSRCQSVFTFAGPASREQAPSRSTGVNTT
jgi:hypothetical protein